MATKYKIIKKNKYHIIDYDKIAKPFEFRYHILKAALKKFGSAVMIVDTNACASAKRPKPDIAFTENDIKFSPILIKTSKGKILGILTEGFKRSKEVLPEKMFFFEMAHEKFTKEFFYSGLSQYDIALGFECSLSIDEMIREYRNDIADIFFEDEFFKDFAYDSILFRRFRATMNVSQLTEGYVE